MFGITIPEYETILIQYSIPYRSEVVIPSVFVGQLKRVMVSRHVNDFLAASTELCKNKSKTSVWMRNED